MPPDPTVSGHPSVLEGRGEISILLVRSLSFLPGMFIGHYLVPEYKLGVPRSPPTVINPPTAHRDSFLTRGFGPSWRKDSENGDFHYSRPRSN